MEAITEIFKPVHPNYVGIFAKLFYALLAIQTTVSFGQQLRYFKTKPAKIYGKSIRVFDKFQLPSLTENQFIIIGLLFIIGLICALFGFLPRIFTFISLLCYFPYFNSIMSLAYIQRKTNLIPLVLLILLFSPSINTPLNEPATIWEIVLIKIGIVQMYLSSAIQKLQKSGLAWCNGENLQAYLIQHFLWGDSKFALELAQNKSLCMTLSILTLVFEMTFWIIIFIPELTIIYVLTAFLFHLGTLISMKINYLKYLSPVYMVFFAEFVYRLINK